MNESTGNTSGIGGIIVKSEPDLGWSNALGQSNVVNLIDCPASGKCTLFPSEKCFRCKRNIAETKSYFDPI